MSHFIISDILNSEENLLFIASAGRWGPTLAVLLGLSTKLKGSRYTYLYQSMPDFSEMWWKLNGYHRLRIYWGVTANGRMKTSCFLVRPSSLRTQNMMEGICLRVI